MSGGIDSTYAAFKLIEEGHEVEGAVIAMHEYTEVDEAKDAADSLGIPLHIIDARDAFNRCVIPNFMSEYTRGRTPNPCIICNSEVKFRILADYAAEHGFDRIATGHYAKIVEKSTAAGTRYAICRAEDTAKDQTYMLWRLPQDILSRLLLPLGNSRKEELREEASAMGMSAAERPDSQEICFIPDGDYAAYIEERMGPSLPGDFVDDEGRVLGRHKGIIHYTVGQRKGLGIALGERVFVTVIDPEANRITLSKDAKNGNKILISGTVFSGIPEPTVGESRELLVKIRYQSRPVPCTLTYLGEGRAVIQTAEPVRSVTAGQSAVLYEGDVLALGGFIDGTE